MRKLAVLSALLFIFTVSVNAQERQKRMRKGSEFTPEQKATLQTKKLALALDLTDKQQKDVYNLMKESSIEREAKMKLHKERRANDIELTSQEKFDIENERLNKQIAHKAAMKNILNKDQYAKWEKMKGQKKKQQKRAYAHKKNKKGPKGKGA